jgi:DNA adenine methylase
MTAYHGGKYRHGKQIAEIINELYDKCRVDINGYIEPFCGMCGVYRHVVNMLPKSLKYIASDQHDSLILMWKALQNAWIPPKKDCSVKQFDRLKHSAPSAIKAYYGFGSSFSGIYFCGHRSKYNDDTFKENKSDELVDIAKDMKNVKFYKRCYSYYTINKFTNYIIYCDPPYSNTRNNLYYNDDTLTLLKFDSTQFWNWCRIMSKCNIVLITEYNAPKDFVPIYTFKNNSVYRSKQTTKLEKLYIHKSFSTNK